MKNTMLKKIGGAIFAISMLVVFAQIRVTAQDDTSEIKTVDEQSQEDSNRKKDEGSPLEGSWSSVVTLRVCATGAEIRSFPAMSTFMRGGTTQEFGVGNGLLRGPGQGVWRRISGRNYYSTFQFFRFNADGTHAGRVTVRNFILLNQFASEITSAATTEFTDVNGVVLMTGCSTVVGTRFQ